LAKNGCNGSSAIRSPVFSVSSQSSSTAPRANNSSNERDNDWAGGGDGKSNRTTFDIPNDAVFYDRRKFCTKIRNHFLNGQVDIILKLRKEIGEHWSFFQSLTKIFFNVNVSIGAI